MVEFLPKPKILARTLIAGVLAWVLAIQGLAASQHLGADVSANSPVDIALCSTDSSSEQHAPGRHDSCPCCILCPLCQLGGLAFMPAIEAKGTDLAILHLGGVISHYAIFSESIPPPGWTSAWSQRAPPQLS